MKNSEIPRKRFFTEHQDHPASVTISVGVSKFDKIPIYFAKPEVMVNQHYCHSQVLRYMIPQMQKISKNRHFIFSQEGTRSHTTKDTIKYLPHHIALLKS